MFSTVISGFFNVTTYCRKRDKIMAKFCKKCGGKLDVENGLCPNCDGKSVKNNSSVTDSIDEAIIENEEIHENNLSTGKDKEKRNSVKKADKKALKREKRKHMSTRQKISRIILKLITILLVFFILAIGCICTFIYFGIITTPTEQLLLGNFSTDTQSEVVSYDNGDTVYRPGYEYIAYDPKTASLYFNNLIMVYTYYALSESEAELLADMINGELVGDISGIMNVIQIKVQESTVEELNKMAEMLMESESVLYAEYGYPIQLEETQADMNPWDSDKDNPESDRGNESNPVGNDWWAEAIGAYTAWNNYSEDCSPIKVGVLDNGFFDEHDDLEGQIILLPNYENSIDDTYSEHGTHVAGIIAAKNNEIGIRGIADKASLICADWTPIDGADYISTGEYIEIMKQLIENDAKVINCSWGSSMKSKTGYIKDLFDIDISSNFYPWESFAVHITGSYNKYVEYVESVAKRSSVQCMVMMIQLLLTEKDDFIIVQSAGNGYDDDGKTKINEGINAKYSGFFCAVDESTYELLGESILNQLSEYGISFEDLENRILVVGAVANTIDSKGNYKMTSFSDYGDNVNICAPGENIYSTVLNNEYDSLPGTSMAAPMVSASAAFIWSLNPNLEAPEVRDYLLKNYSVKAVGVGNGSAFSYPMLNVGLAAQAVAEARGEIKGKYNENDIPDDAVEFNGHYYYLYDLEDIMTWDEAEAYCEQQNGYLATITSQEENDFIYFYMKQKGYDSAYFGLYDSAYNEWRWVTDEAVEYVNWNENEPSSYQENYGMFYCQYSDGTWNDGDFGNITLNDGKAFICEWGEYQVVQKEADDEAIPSERNVVLVLDTSDSMYGKPMEETQKASLSFIETVLEEDAGIGIVTYNNFADCASDFTDNKGSLESAVTSIESNGRTNIEEGLSTAFSMLNNSSAKKKIIVLMSDGQPNEGRTGDALAAYADEIKDDGILIYTLGFFENLEEDKSSAQALMERIASEGCHYEVADADDLVYFFEDMADQINGQKYIYARIACPVDVFVTYNGQTLSSSENDMNLRTNFGTLSFEESENSSYGEENDMIKILRLKEGADYNLQIIGTGRGLMNYTIGFMNEEGNYSDFRSFENIKITKKTVIDTVAAVSDESILNIDEDGDGRYDLKYRAEENGYGEEVKLNGKIYVVTAGGVAAVAVIIIIFINKTLKKRKER